MDPTLRKPLLALLQRKYGYKDGDFELVRTELPVGEVAWTWPENESAEAWMTGEASSNGSLGG